MGKTYNKYFLAANSYSGFVSNFKDNFFAEKDWRAYIIKGGPGTGKSSFMKSIAKKADEKGYTVTLCPCSSDPDSLDALLIEELKTIILDGTAPHTLDPVYAGVCEEIINLGEFWDAKKLSENRYSIISATNINKALHKTAALYLNAAEEVRLDTLKTAENYTKKDKAISFANEICKKYIGEKIGKYGFQSVRYIEGITPKGIITFEDTILNSADKILILCDKEGAVSSIILKQIRDYALHAGYEIITVKNPYLPNEAIDHIIIPKLRFAFATESEYIKFPKDLSRIHSRRFTNSREKSAAKNRLSFNAKIEKELLSSAVDILKKAKASHDVLEKYYIDAMDFEEMHTFTQNFANNLLN